MKKLTHFIWLLAVLFWLPAKAATFTVDMRTGINNTTNALIPLVNTPDDTWMVKLPGGSAFQSVYCGTGAPAGYSPYVGKDPSVRWLSPYLNNSGAHTDAGVSNAFYEYRMRFYADICGTTTNAAMNFSHIGADDEIQQILVNGNVHAVSYGFNPFSNSVSVPLANGEIIAGWNEIIVKVWNIQQYIGMEINGSLTYQGNATSGFWLSTTPGGLQGYTNTGGTHLWEVYSLNNGLTTLLGTFNTASFSISSAAECYLVKHTSHSEECGDLCEAQTICRSSCENAACNLEAPKNLFTTSIDGTHVGLNWDPVPGAVGYVVEVYADDPACCQDVRGGGNDDGPVFAGNFINATVYTNSYSLDISRHPNPMYDGPLSCYSWRVYALCANGTRSPWSYKVCSNGAIPGGGGGGGNSPLSIGRPDDQNGAVTNNKNKSGNTTINQSTSLKAVVNVYPNPANEQVNIEIVAMSEMRFNIAVYDSHGKVIRSIQNQQTNNRKAALKLNTHEFTPGEYLVVFSAPGHQNIAQKVIIK